MEYLDAPSHKEPGGTGGQGRITIDRFETALHFDIRDEEEKVEAAMALYEKAARARMPADFQEDTEPDPEELEALEAQSQWLKLQQKCQDIAALMLVDELEDELEEEPEEEHKKRRH